MDREMHRQADALRLPPVFDLPLGAHFVRGRGGDSGVRGQVSYVSLILVRDRGHDHGVLAAARDLRDGHGDAELQ